eukprot:Hpha_TRINITY_DN20397_c0_g1::TRINITY_DN20397_c0_g1_i1::g.138229::m.138229
MVKGAVLERFGEWCPEKKSFLDHNGYLVECNKPGCCGSQGTPPCTRFVHNVERFSRRSPPQPARPQPAGHAGPPAASNTDPVDVTIFWDFANMRIVPTDRVDAVRFLRELEDQVLRALNRTGKIVWSGHLYSNARTYNARMPRPDNFLDMLSTYGVYEVKTGSKQGQDDKAMMDAIRRFKGPGVAIVMTSDKDYAQELRDMFRSQIPFVLVYSVENASRAFYDQFPRRVEWEGIGARIGVNLSNK